MSLEYSRKLRRSRTFTQDLWPAVRPAALAVVTAVSLLALPMMVSTASTDPMSVIKTGLSQALAVFNDRRMTLKERREKLRGMSWRYFDFQSMAKSSLGSHWRDLTTSQHDEFVSLFAEFIQDAYLSKMEQTTVEKVQLEAKSAKLLFIKQTYSSADYAEVYSTVKLQDREDPLAVNYLMHLSGGQWRVYDLTIDEISVIANYRNQFNRIINNQGYDRLISDLRTKSQQLRQYMRQEARSSAPR